MSYSIPSSNTFVTLATASFLFLIVGILCLPVPVVPGMYILLSPRKEEVHSSS